MEHESNNLPLVSICATFFNAERYIHRLIESCLHQTYANIELVLVDDLSTDKSEQVIREYANRDPRIVYHKNNTRVGLGESELTMFTVARGEYCMMVGADDWLGADCIEHGVQTFLAHPEAVGVVPQGIWLGEKSDGTFTLIDNRFYEFSSPMVYSAEWFMKRFYKPKQLYVSAFALVRSKDYAHAMKYYLDNYYYNLPALASLELKHFAKMAFGMDGVVIPEMLTRHKTIVFNSSLRYIKIGLPEGQANNLDLFHQSIGDVFKAFWYQLRMFTAIYKQKWPRYYWGMKMFKGAEALCVVCVGIVRTKFSLSFFRTQEHKQFIRDFFSAFSTLEIIGISFYAVCMLGFRPFVLAKRKLTEHRTKEAAIFTRENFLNSDKYFQAT